MGQQWAQVNQYFDTSVKMDADEYESLPTASVGIHMTAGAMAGILEHCVMYPVDSVKTRMQSLQPAPDARYKGVFEALTKMIKTEGLGRPVRGVTAVISGAGPAHALYFSSYEFIKKELSNSLRTAPHQNHLVHGAAGSAATLLHDAIMTPADAVKQRMQMYNSPHSSCYACIQAMYQREGIRAFYRSYSTQLVMNIPFQVIHFMTYEWFQNITNHSRSYNPLAHVVSGAFSGALAAAMTTPLDVCKTLLNTQEQNVLLKMHRSHVVGLVSACRTVYSIDGPKGFFKGIRARILYQMPSTAIAWSVYEFFKHYISSRDKHGKGPSSSSPHASDVHRDSLLCDNSSVNKLTNQSAFRSHISPSKLDIKTRATVVTT